MNDAYALGIGLVVLVCFFFGVYIGIKPRTQPGKKGPAGKKPQGCVPASSSKE